jgi:hypothetical protein
MLHAQNWPANSVSCYMHRTGLSEELALEHVRNLIDENRKKLNKERLDDSLLAKPFIGTAFNLARQAHCALSKCIVVENTLSDLTMIISVNMYIIQTHVWK